MQETEIGPSVWFIIGFIALFVHFFEVQYMAQGPVSDNLCQVQDQRDPRYANRYHQSGRSAGQQE